MDKTGNKFRLHDVNLSEMQTLLRKRDFVTNSSDTRLLRPAWVGGVSLSKYQLFFGLTWQPLYLPVIVLLLN